MKIRAKAVLSYLRIGMFAWLGLSPGMLRGDQTLYRYEAYPEGSRPLNITEYDPILSRLPGRGESARGSPEGPFTAVLFGEFRGEQAYAFSAFTGEEGLSGDFSIEAIMRPQDGPQNLPQVLLSNEPEGGGAGIHLYLKNGYVIGRIWLEGQDGADPVELISDRQLETGEWTRIVYTVDYDPSKAQLAHALWFDEEPLAEESIPSGTQRLSSPLAPVVGAAREGDGLYADILALQVYDYVLSEYYLKTHVIRDGSTYLGIPSYHNYLGLDESGDLPGGLPFERRLVETYYDLGMNTRYPELDRLMNKRWFVPLTNDGYVVQGMAGDPENRRLFLSMYHRDIAGTSYTYPSIVVEILLPEGTLGNVFMLQDETGNPFNSHVGGVAYWDGMLFLPGPPRSVSMDPDLYVFDISETAPASFVPSTMEGFSERQLKATWKVRDPVGILGDEWRFNSLSFMGIHMDAFGQVILHLGNFQSDRAAPVHLFELETDGNGIPVLSYLATHMESHRRSQGAYYYYDSEVSARKAWKSFLATSYGSNDSILYTNLNLEGRDTPISSEAIRMPAGLEESFVQNDQLWLTSESGSLYYQKRTSPWTHLFPFMVQVDVNEWVDLNDNRILDEWESRYGLSGQQDSTKDEDMDGFDLYTEFLWDTDPRSASHFPDMTLNQAPLSLSMETARKRFYTLQEGEDLNTWTDSQDISHRRGSGGAEIFSIQESGPAIFYRVLIELD